MSSVSRRLPRAMLAGLALAGLLVGGWLWARIHEQAGLTGLDVTGFLVAFLEGGLANPVSRVLLLGVLSAFLVLLYMIGEARRHGMPHCWIYVLLAFTTPFPFAIAFFFFMRARWLQSLDKDGARADPLS